MAVTMIIMCLKTVFISVNYLLEKYLEKYINVHINKNFIYK